MLAFCSQGGGLNIASGGEAHLSECVVSGNEAYWVRARLSVTFHRPVGELTRLCLPVHRDFGPSSVGEYHRFELNRVTVHRPVGVLTRVCLPVHIARSGFQYVCAIDSNSTA